MGQLLHGLRQRRTVERAAKPREPEGLGQAPRGINQKTVAKWRAGPRRRSRRAAAPPSQTAAPLRQISLQRPKRFERFFSRIKRFRCIALDTTSSRQSS